MAFEQAAIPIERHQEFQALRGAIQEVFSPSRAEKFLRLLKGEDVPVRRFEEVLAKGLIERAHPRFGGHTARDLYGALTVSDQAQLREFYLQELEKVPPELRKKFSGLYRDS